MSKIKFIGLVGICLLPLLVFYTLPRTLSSSLPWTRENAIQLAESTLFYADSGTIDALYRA